MNVRIRVLGAVELAAANGEPTLPRWPRVRRLLAVLLVHAGEVVSVDRLGDALWGAEAPADRTSAVHNLVSRLRAALRSAGAGDTVRVVTRAPGYVLEVDATAVDCIRFAGIVETARNRLDEAPQVAAALLDEAWALWHGPAFGEFADEEFARPEAARLEELRQEAAADRVDAAIALGRNDEAVGMLEPLLAADPLRERPRRQLMRALHRAGRSVEALQVYRDYRERLNAELGLDPSPELRELQAAIIRRDPGIGWIAPSSPPTNLPQPRGDLVGRAEDVIQVVDALRRARLVTLTGVGGVGKTRLALHVAAEVTAEHPDGVWLCELAALGEEAVAEGVAAVLGVRPRHELTMTARLVEYLREKRLLIVLDNCEHVTAAAGRLVDALLRGCPRVQVLATSREPLDVDGERVLPVAPLATPPRVAGGPEAVAEVASVPAGQRGVAVLRVDRGQQRGRGGGLPAAGRPAAGAGTGGAQGADPDRRGDRRPARQPPAFRPHRRADPRAAPPHAARRRRLVLPAARRAAARGLRPLERVRRLVHPARRRAGRGEQPRPGRDRRRAQRTGGPFAARRTAGRPTRYSMLETLRHYGLERLSARGRGTATRRDHAAYHVELAASASVGLTGRDPGRWIETMDHHLDDLRAAHSWAVAHEPDLAMRLSEALFWYLEPGMFAEAAVWAERAIAASPPSHPLRPVVEAVAAFGATRRGDLGGAIEHARRALAISAEHDASRRYAVFVLGEAALFEGRLDESGRCYREAARLAEEAGDTYTYTAAVVNLAFPLAYQGSSARALTAAQRGRSAAVASGSPHLIAWADYVLGEVLAEDDPQQAMVALDAALALARESGSRFIEGVALVSAASLRARHGDPYEALNLFARVVDQWHRAGNWTQQWTTLRNVIDLFVRLSADETAVVLCAAMRASRSAPPPFGSDAARLAETDAALRARLPEQNHRHALARGAAMTDDEAVSFTLAEINRLGADRGQAR